MGRGMPATASDAANTIAPARARASEAFMIHPSPDPLDVLEEVPRRASVASSPTLDMIVA